MFGEEVPDARHTDADDDFKDEPICKEKASICPPDPSRLQQETGHQGTATQVKQHACRCKKVSDNGGEISKWQQFFFECAAFEKLVKNS